MFSQSPGRFVSGQDPWFRIGTTDVGTTGIAAIVVLVGLFLSAAEGNAAPISSKLLYFGGDVADGQVWRLFTWWTANDVSLNTIFSIVMIVLIGGQIEGVLRRVKMAKYLLVLVTLHSFLALALYTIGLDDLVLIGANRISSALFYTLILLRPGIRFFFGIPAWALGGVFLLIEFLALLQDRDWTGVIFFFLALGGIALAAKAFGLANDVAAIPDVRKLQPSGATEPSGYSAPSSERPTSRRRRSSKKRGTGAPPIVGVDASFEEMGIDEILDQISAFGMDSLNASQRKKLEAYSKGRKKD